MALTKFLASLFLLFSSLATAEEMYVTVPQGKLYCNVVGQGKPLIVIHGGPGMSQEYLLPYLGRLAQNNQVIFYDQRGCGRSEFTPTIETITIDSFIEDIEAIRKNFGFKKISILGHSWGGHLAMLYAIRYPETIDKLILSNTGSASSKDFALFAQEVHKRLGTGMQEIEKLTKSDAFKAGDPETFVQYYSLINHSYCYYPNNADRIHVRQSPSANINGYKTYEILRDTYISQPYDLFPQLQKLVCKTLIIHGDSEPIPLVTAQNIQKAIPGSRIIVLPKCGHFPYIETPEPYYNHITRFLHDEK